MEAEKTLNKKAQQWIEDNIGDDREMNMTIAELSKAAILDKLDISIEFPEVALIVYGVTFSTIIQKLKDRRESDKKAFSIEIGNIVEIGWDNSKDDGESEKIGNFSPYIMDLSSEQANLNDIGFDSSMCSTDRCTEWNSAHIVRDKVNFFNDIATTSLKELVEQANLHLSHPEIIFPMFYIIHKQMVESLKLTLVDEDEDEYVINFCGCIEATVWMDENRKPNIGFKHQPSTKLEVKSDAGTTAIHE